MDGPLSGIRVVELGTLIAAPFAARLLAEFGAEVIKIEQPGSGDPLRRWRKLHQGTSLWWYLQSRNKKSIAIDLKSPDGLDVALRLAAQADVVIENFRPGSLEKLGLGWDVLSKLNPDLDTGPHLRLRADRPLPRPLRVRRDRRGHGRAALHHRRSRQPAGPGRHQHRRQPGLAPWRDRRADVAAASQDRAGARAGGRRLAL